ncbi:SgrR family transcriptional regulator [Paenibacillus sp. CF384]|uniref:SgrR family transcriptional regulator n=1 Tax=Paenibacillus sp. CF384 TaxID=1884382 RepID=UPI00089B97CC|nr:SgrR family transcriptional regulator [Paenibacillus sp. CF384]SDW61127.1 Sugar transport-related sRNA regulator N-term [Paenibacillus sp. CF384]
MLTIEHYLTLYRRFADKLRDEVEVSLVDVADALYCTERNARLILRKLSEESFIEWKAGQGRGNRSRIIFREDNESLLLGLAQKFTEAGDCNKAFHLLQTFSADTATIEIFMAWMSNGLSSL